MINVSFQIRSNPVPFSMMDLMMIIYHLAGMIFEIHCRITGIFSIGKINPDNRMVGRINAIRDIIRATCWEEVTEDIKMPRDSTVMMNNSGMIIRIRRTM